MAPLSRYDSAIAGWRGGMIVQTGRERTRLPATSALEMSPQFALGFCSGTYRLEGGVILAAASASSGGERVGGQSGGSSSKPGGPTASDTRRRSRGAQLDRREADVGYQGSGDHAAAHMHWRTVCSGPVSSTSGDTHDAAFTRDRHMGALFSQRAEPQRRVDGAGL